MAVNRLSKLGRREHGSRSQQTQAGEARTQNEIPSPRAAFAYASGLSRWTVWPSVFALECAHKRSKQGLPVTAVTARAGPPTRERIYPRSKVGVYGCCVDCCTETLKQ